MTITITGADEVAARLNAAADQLESEVDMSLEAAMEQVADYARSIAPVKTGEYADSIQVVRLDTMHYGLTATAGHAAIIEFGSAAHLIEVVNAKALHFEVEGEEVFAKYVQHPGTAPQMILHTALDANHDMIVDAVRQGVMNALGI